MATTTAASYNGICGFSTKLKEGGITGLIFQLGHDLLVDLGVGMPLGLRRKVCAATGLGIRVARVT